MEFERQRVGCCGGKMCSLVIGWFHMMSCGIFCFISITDFIFYSIQIYKFNSSDGKDMHGSNIFQELSSMIAVIILFFIGLVSGIYLIAGVKQENIRKLKIWFVIEWLFVIAGIVSLLIEVILAIWPGVVRETIFICLSLIFLLVVNTHVKELRLNMAAKEFSDYLGFSKF